MEKAVGNLFIVPVVKMILFTQGTGCRMGICFDGYIRLRVQVTVVPVSECCLPIHPAVIAQDLITEAWCHW